MAGKRSAGYDLNADNWDLEDEPEERGVFKTATSDELKNRVIKKATRRRMPNTDGETPKIGAFASFSGFGKSSSAATTLSAVSSSSPFSFLSKMSSVTSTTGSLTTSVSSSSSKDNTDNKNGNSPSNSNEEYHSKLKGLNLAVLEWIKSHLEENPLVILSPIFKDYEKHLTEIQKSNTNAASKEKVQIISDFKLGSKLERHKENYSLGSPQPKVDTKSQLKDSKAIEKKGDELQKSNFSFGNSSNTVDAPESTFSFGSKTQGDETTKSTFSFGTKFAVPVSSSKTFSFGCVPEDKKEKTGFSFGSSSTEEPKTSFSFGASSTTSAESKPFSFGSTVKDDNKDVSVKQTFSFGSNAPSSAGFSFSGSAPFSFGGVAPASSTSTDTKEEEDENEEPPKVEFTQVEENDSIFSKKCKVFVKNEDKFGDRGVGTLHLKPVEGQKKIQLIVRADTNLGNLLLNLLLNESVPTKRMGKKDVILVGVPMPTDKKPTQILIRVKTEEEADKLLETLEKHKNQE